MPLISEKSLAQHKARGLYRNRLILQRSSGMLRWYQGKSLLSFCSNDYLGLSQHPIAIKAFKQTADDYGVGSGSSHFLGAYSQIHHELEQALAQFLGYPHVLVYSTGYMANLGVLSTLLSRHSIVFADRLNHASLIDGVKLSMACCKRYTHNSMTELEKQLIQFPARQRLIVTEGVFSMDGDLAPLPDLIEKAKNYSATLFVDDAHGLGVLGENGAGISDHFKKKPDILSGGFGKVLGSLGGFVASSSLIIESLLQFSRPYMYTTALTPSIAKAVYTNLQLLQTESWRRERLQALIAYFKQGTQQRELPFLPSRTPIQALLIGEAQQASALAAHLFQNGFLLHAIRPPTVPHKTSRLRITLSTLHSESQIDNLLEQIALGLKRLKIRHAKFT